jgi:hypothetical protein
LIVVAAAIAVIATALLALGPSAATAQDAPTDASLLLDRVAGADDTKYRSRQLVVYFGNPQSAALLDVRSSGDGRFVHAESGRDVTRVWAPEDVEAVDGADAKVKQSAPTSMTVRPSAVLAKYELDVERPSKHLGVELIPIALSRRRDNALVERWWVHERSGVLYRRALYDASGKLVGMSTVIDMEWGKPAPADPIETGDVDAWVRARPAPGTPERLPGAYELWQTYEVEIEGVPTEQWVYSDGLHALSVFRSSGNFRAPQGFTSSPVGDHTVWRGPGPGTWAWEGAGSTWMMVAEESALQPGELIEAFPQGGPSVWARMGSVWSRLFDAIGRAF